VRQKPIALLLLTLAAAGCRGTNMHTTADSAATIAAVPEEVRQLRVVFGHQSVGYDLLKGLEEWQQGGAPLRLRMVETTDASALDAPGIVHFRIGRNGDPASKIREWATVFDTGFASRADVALFKLCYDDFAADTDVEALFALYSSTVDDLARRHPNTLFVPVTVPLTTLQTGVKALVKKALGRPVGEERENIRREAFNALVRRYYGQRLIFDLAAVESETPDAAGKTVRALKREWTSDGGHLNASGRRVAAHAFAGILVEASRPLAAAPAAGW
jgi:hypothetical protein